MRFILSFLFLASIFYTEAKKESFLRRCDREGRIDVEGTIRARLSSTIADLSTHLSKYYAQCLVIALRKNTNIRNKREHEQLRKALQCQLKHCVDKTFGADKFGNISFQLSTSINRVNPRCEVLSNYKRGSLNKVVYSSAVKAALDCEYLKQTSLKGVLHQLEKVVGDAFGSAQGSVLANLDFDDLLDGLVVSVNGLLISLLENLEFALLVGPGSISGSRRVREEIFNVYKCDLENFRNRVHNTCTELCAAMDEFMLTVAELRAPFDFCLHEKHADILDLHYGEIIHC